MILIAGVGSAHGDDAVGLAVADSLQDKPLPATLRVLSTRDPATLLHHVDDMTTLFVVDAMLGSPAGQCIEILLNHVAESELQTVSSHGVSVASVLQLMRTLQPELSVRILGVTVGTPDRTQQGLSAAVRAAVEPAANLLLQWAQGLDFGANRG